MSDVHGEYDMLLKMLDLISFSSDDFLYIIGDAIDRGDKPIDVVSLIMNSSNMCYLAGNHEVMLLQCAKLLLLDVTQENLDNLSEKDMLMLTDYMINGGDKTLQQLRGLSVENRKQIFEFIADCDLYCETTVNGKDFVLVHSTLGNFDADKSLSDYTLDELVWMRADFNQKYYDDKIIIAGHTPTQAINEFTNKGYIYHGNNFLDIDCGCTFNGGRLACLRLDDMKEFYVEK